MDPHQLADAIAHLKFTADLPAVVRRQLVDDAAMIDLKPGDVLFRCGAEASELYLIQEGRLVLEMEIEGRELTPVAELGAGDFAGWSSLIGTGKLTTTATAITDMQVIVIPGSRLAQICKEDPGAGLSIMTRIASGLAQRLVRTRQRLIQLLTPGN